MTHYRMEVLLSSSVIRTTALADVAGRIVGTTRLTDVIDPIISPPALADMTGRIVGTSNMSDAVICSATPCGVSRGIVRSAHAEGAVRCSACADAYAAMACASAAMACASAAMD